MFRLIRQAFESFSSKSWSWFALLGLAIFLHSAGIIKGGLYADDYIHAAYFQGAESLERNGVLSGIGSGDFLALLSQQFNFFDPASENYQALKDVGVLPWWIGDDALLHFFRPLATVTHYLDYQFWPNNSHLMHLVNVLWYVLALLAIGFLYKSLALNRSVIFLALLLIILDLSVFQVVSWIASRSMLMLIAFGFFSIAAYHLAEIKKEYALHWYIASLVSFSAALLSAEGGVAIAGYLGAYCFTLDKRQWQKRVLALLPFAAIVIIWRLYYQSHGFGAFGVDFYLDPVREPLIFLHAAFYRYPGNFFELWTGIDITSGQIRADIRQYFAIAGVMVFSVLAYSLRSFLFGHLRSEHQALGFLALGCLFSLVPGLSVALSPRVMLLPNVGFAVLLAYGFLLLPLTVYKKAMLERSLMVFMNSYTLLSHIILSFIFAFTLWYSTVDFSNEKIMARGNVDLGVQNHADKSIIVINAPRPFWMSFIPYELAYKNQPLPKSVRVLSSAFYPINVERITGQRLLLSSHPAFQLDPEYLRPYEQQEQAHYAFLTQQLLGLNRSAREPWRLNVSYEFADLTITIKALNKGKPSQIQVDFNLPADQLRFVYWDMQNKAYQSFVLPNVGEQILLKGIFDVELNNSDD